MLIGADRSKLEQFAGAANEGNVAIDPSVWERVSASAEIVARHAAGDAAVYGVRTPRTIVESQSVCVGVTQAAWIPVPREQL